jgi:hypothetical protein
MKNIEFSEVIGVKDGLAEKGRRITHRDSVVTVRAGGYVYLENCRRVVEYNDIRISAEIPEGLIYIWGSSLYADTCSGDTLAVYGDIQSIEWVRKGAGAGEKS